MGHAGDERTATVLMAYCTRCGIQSSAHYCRDCTDVLADEKRRAEKERTIARMLKDRDQIAAELAQIDSEIIALLEQHASKKRPRNIIPPCGTESAYQRHRARGEERDEACKKAHAAHNRARHIARKDVA